MEDDDGGSSGSGGAIRGALQRATVRGLKTASKAKVGSIPHTMINTKVITKNINKLSTVVDIATAIPSDKADKDRDNREGKNGINKGTSNTNTNTSATTGTATTPIGTAAASVE